MTLATIITLPDFKTLTEAADCARSGIAQYAFGLWYPSMKGRTFERRITPIRHVTATASATRSAAGA